jgi:DNA-binding response OmpR family regulator
LIKAPLDELETQETLSERGKKLLSVAMDNTDKIFDLITQLLDLQKEDRTIEKLMFVEKKSSTSFVEREDIYDISSEKNVLLLAEEDDDMREYLTESLSKEYQVICVADGEKLLSMAKEVNPDIIISDVLIPVLRGDEVCRILKSSIETSHIPFILLSALREKENVIFGLEAGANDYIIKPFDFSVLNARIRNIIQSRRQLRKMAIMNEPNLEDMDYVNRLDKYFLDRVNQILESELGNSEFSINDFCRKLGMSRSSVYHKLKTLTDQAPNDLIRILRLNKSKELLESKKYTIAEISDKVGFSDPKYFSTSFKKHFGVSPSKLL